MVRVVEGWSVPNGGFKFWLNPPVGCRVTGSDVGRECFLPRDGAGSGVG